MRRLILGVTTAFVFTTGFTTGQAPAEGLPPTSRIAAPGVVLGPSWEGFYVGAGIGAGALSYDVSGEAKKSKKVKKSREVQKSKKVKKSRQVKKKKQEKECKKRSHHYPYRCKKWKSVWVDYYETEYYYETVNYSETEYYYDREYYTEAFSDSGTGDIGIFGVLAVGYDRVLRPGWIAGVFADYDFGSGISADLSFPGYSGSIDHNYSWAVGGRIGHLLTPSMLVYGAGGYTQANFDIDDLGSKTFDGYFVGAGMETFLRQNWTLKLEYRYSDFGAETIVDTPSLTADLDPSMHSARLVLTYKLGQGD